MLSNGLEFSICFYVAIAVFTIWLSMQVNSQSRLGQAGEKGIVQNKILLYAIFSILFLVSALRFGVGNDYENYAYTAHEASVNGYVVTEPGFNWLVKVVYALFGGEYYEIVFALFAFATIGIFLKAMYEQSEAFDETFFLFMTLGLYFQTFNTMRYYLALAMAFYASRYVLKKDWIRFVLWIAVASLFHKSVLIVLFLYWLCTLTWKRWFVILITAGTALCFVLQKPLLWLALYLYPSYRNTQYLEGGTSLPSIVRSALILVFMLWVCKTNELKDNRRHEILFYGKLNYLSLLVYTGFSFLPVITRIGYYVTVFQILLIPLLIRQIGDEKKKKMARSIVIIASVIYFLFFLFTAHKPGVGLLPYQSWLFSTERFSYK